jgi:hypothetical protein
MSIALVIRHANFIICVSYYIIIWTVWLNHIFPPRLINSTTFWKKVMNIKYVLIFYTATFLILRRTARDTVDVLKFSCKVCCYCVSC